MQEKTAHTDRPSYVLIFLFLLLATGIITGGYVYYRNYKQHFRTEVEKQLSSITSLKVKQLVRWRRERLGDAATLSKNTVFIQLVRRFLDNPKSPGAEKKLLAWFTLYQSFNDYEDIFFLDLQGRKLLVSPDRARLICPELKQQVPEIIRSATPVFLDLHRHTSDQDIHFSVIAPVLDQGLLLGLIVLDIDARAYLYPFLNDWPTSSKTAETLLVRREGDGVLFLNNLKYKQNAALKLYIPLTKQNIPAVQAVLGHTGIVEGVDYRGVAVFANVLPVPDSPWFMVARMDSAEVYEPLKDRRSEMGFLLVALLLCLGSGLVVYWRQQRIRFYRSQLDSISESAKQLRSVLDATPFPVAVVDLYDTNISFWSRSALELFGHYPSTTTEWYERAYPDPGYRRDVIDRWKPMLEKARLTRKAVNAGEYRVACVDGSVRICELHVIFLSESLMVIFNDITERSYAERQLKDNNEELQQLFKSMINAFVIFDSVFDDAGRFVSYRFVYINPAFENITGVTNDEVFGKTVHEVWPETEPEWIQRYGEVAVTGVAQSFDLYHGPTKKLYHCNVYRPADSQDRFCVVFEDITQRKQAEEALALQAGISKIFLTAPDEEMYNHVLDVVLEVMNSPFGVFGYIDEDGALVVPTMTRHVWDKCQVHDKIIRFPRDTWGDSSWPRAIQEKKFNVTNEPSRKVPDGHVAIIRHITVPIMVGNTVVGLFQIANKPAGYTDDDIRILHNIAEHVAPILSARVSRDRYEKSLQERNDELARFSYTMSHDLKSPLVTIQTFLGYLEKDFQKQDTERIIKDFAFIRGAADKMSRLLDELLDMARVGRVENPESVAPLQVIVQEALELVAGRISERGVTVDVTPQPLMLRGDRVRLVEVFQNLIDNAVKFMGDQREPRIYIGWLHKDGETQLFVRDNGMGIDPRYQKKLFDLFEKIDTSFEGTGIGLALVKRILEVHGGRIWVESEGLGKGTCFWFTLPGRE